MRNRLLNLPQLSQDQKHGEIPHFLLIPKSQPHFFKTAPQVSAFLSVTKTVKHQFLPVFSCSRICIFIPVSIPLPGIQGLSFPQEF